VVNAGQEFLDAFPIHQFSHTENGWRERLVDINTAQKAANVAIVDPADSDTPPPAGGEEEMDKLKLSHTDALHFRFVNAPGSTPASKILLKPTQAAHSSFTTPKEQSDLSSFVDKNIPVGAGLEVGIVFVQFLMCLFVPSVLVVQQYPSCLHPQLSHTHHRSVPWHYRSAKTLASASRSLGALR
jgi:hypothetical protein